MSIEAKTTFLNELHHQLSSIVTVADMDKILMTINNQLDYYEMQQKERSDEETDDLLDAYISAMQIQGRSPKTIERYTYLIKRMMRAVKVPTRRITVYHLRQYLSDEMARGISDRTIEGTRQVFSTYFNWLQRESLIQTNPVANLGAVKCRKKIKHTYSDIDMERLKLACPNLRDRAIVTFLGSTGCRISEMTQLNRNDIDFNALECTVLGKGNKERTVYLDQIAGMVLQEYLATRKDNYEALFIGKGSQRLTPHGVRFMLTTLADKAGVDHVHPHKFRRTLATNLIKHGMPIQEVAAILGHDKLDTTMQYVILDKTDVKHDYCKYI